MEDVPVTAEGMLALTWTLNVLVFVLLVLRLAVHRRPGLNTTAVMTSDALVFISWLFGVASIATDAWKYNQEIQSRTRALSPEEQAIARKVVFPGIFIHHIKLNPLLLQLSFMCGYLVFTAMWLAKGAFVVYCYHLCPGLTPKLRKYLLFVTIFTATTYTTTVLIQTFWCRPMYRSW